MSQETLTMPLWPDAGRILGLSRNSTYEAARRGEIPGLLRLGSKYVVARATLLAALGVGDAAGATAEAQGAA